MTDIDKINSLNNRGTVTQLRKANIKLLNQGGYGCVYTPALKCKNNTQSNKDPLNYILKLQVMNTSAENEIAIGKLISSIPNWKEHFAPIESHCDVDLRQIDETLLDEGGSTCQIFKKSDNLIALTIPYIRDGNFTKNVIEPKHEKTFPCIVHSYQDILVSLEILKNNDIVHYDLKNDNLLYDNDLNKPIIIDFGLSIPFKEIKKIIKTTMSTSIAQQYGGMSLDTDTDTDTGIGTGTDTDIDNNNIDTIITSDTSDTSDTSVLVSDTNENDTNRSLLKSLKKYFYVFATDYYLWCLEIQFICYLVHYNTKLTREIIEEICVSYVETNKAFDTFSNEFLIGYIETAIDFYMQFIGDSPEYIILNLIGYYQTWDNYSLSIMFIKLLSKLYKQKTNKTVQFFYELLLENMHANPSKRKTLEDTIQESNKIFMQNDSIQQLLLLLNQEDIDEKSAINTINKEIDDINIIIKNASNYAKYAT